MSLTVIELTSIMIVSDITMPESKTYPLELDRDLHKELKIRAVEEDKTLKAVMLDALREYLEKKSRN